MQTEDNEKISDFNRIKMIILFNLLDCLHLSNIEDQFLGNISKKLPNRQLFTNSGIEIRNKFIEIIKSISQEMSICFVCVDEWTDKKKMFYWCYFAKTS